MIEVIVKVIHFEVEPIQTFICEELYIPSNGKFIDLHRVLVGDNIIDLISFNVANISSISQRKIEEH